MRYKLFLLGVLVLLRVGGCDNHPLTDYRPLDQAGMWSSNVEELKKLNTSDAEVAQLVKMKQAGLSDDSCVAMISNAHDRKYLFTRAHPAANLSRAGYHSAVILGIPKRDQRDIISGDPL